MCIRTKTGTSPLPAVRRKCRQENASAAMGCWCVVGSVGNTEANVESGFFMAHCDAGLKSQLSTTLLLADRDTRQAGPLTKDNT